MLQQPLEVPGHGFDAGRLLAQADALESLATARRREAAELSQEAIELRVEADRMTRAPLTILGAPVTPAESRDTDFLDRVVSVLEGAGPLAMRDLTEHLNASPARVRAALARLEEIGTVARTGIKNGTRYALADDADDDAEPTPANVHAFQSYETLVRDAAVKLDTFEFVDLQRELPDLSEPTLRRWLRELERRGVFASVRDGHRKVYAYVPAESGGPTTHPRYESPEREAARTAGVEARSSEAVAGTGRAERSGSSIVDALIREVRSLALGITTKKTAHKVVFLRDGVEIAHSSRTPGASSLKTTRATLRKAGVPVK